jgi:hypothetical protein
VSETPTTIYLEADDEVTSVVRRLRAADPGPIVIVAPGRSRATSSVVALRLLGRAADTDGRSVSVVGDALTRSLAAEAGLPAFGTLEDARSAEGGPGPEVEPRHASISVVRGPAADETAPILAALAPSGASPDDLTRPVAVGPSPSPRPAAPKGQSLARRPRRRVGLPVGLLGALALLLVAATIAAAALLPAATVTIVPRSDEIGPVEYEIAVADAERSAGTATATAEVVASGSYAVQEPATGSVVLYNWTFVPVDVPAGTFVAAGEQAFATQADVTVPRGQLTGAGTIAAGDIAVAVVAAAPGPAANVAAEAINVVVDQSVDARLRGFPENPQPRVLNPEPTSGGVDTAGPEITQEDVDAAVTVLREALASQVAEATDTADPDLIAVVAPPGEPVIEVPEGLVGRRDTERVEIGGELPWEVVRADPGTVIEEARSRLVEDLARLPVGHEYLEDSVEVELRQASLADGVLTVPAAVTARSIGRIDLDEVRSRIAGRSAEEAEAALADLGTVSVELWPGWAATVPELEWRVEIQIEERPEEGT